MFRNMFAAGAAAFMLASGAGAASIGNDAFDFSVVDNDSATTFGPMSITAQSVAGACDPLDATTCDGEAVGSGVFIDWIDGDSFDLGFFGGTASSMFIELSGLDFAGGATISNVVYEVGGGTPSNPYNIDEFLANPSNPTGASAPSVIVGFGSSLITINIDSFDGLLWGDGVAMRFDVTTTTPGTPTVPLPAGGVLILTALGGIAALRRRT